jgi:hyperosmotically inducible protein
MRLHPRRRLAPTLLVILITVGGCGKPADVAVGGPGAAPARVNISDDDVSEQVKTALLRTDSPKRMDIAVVTINGDVRPTGILDSQAQIDQAIRIARAVNGVHSIHHELTN